MDVTVAICTFNRIGYLTKCLNEFVRLNDHGVSVMVIDNNCTDGTAEFVKQLQKKHTWISYYFERKKGLSHARNKAIDVCKTRYLFYIDDDAVPEEHYFQQLEVIFQNWKFDAVGGSEIRLYDANAPTWYKALEGSQKNESVARYMVKEYVQGYNMGFKVSSLKAIGGFDPRVGMSGSKIAYGEETLVSKQIRDRGGELLYYPSLLVHHYRRAEKMSLRRCIINQYAQGRDSWITFDKKGNLKDFLYILRSLLLGTIVSIVKSSIVLISGKASFPIFLISLLKQPAFDLGRLTGFRKG